MKHKCWEKLAEQHASASPAHAPKCSCITIKQWEWGVCWGQGCTATSYLTMCVLCAIQQVLTHTEAPQNPCTAPTTQGLSLLHYLCGQQLHAQLPEAESTYFCVAMGVFRCSSVQFQKSITILSFCYASSFIHGYVKAFNHGPGKRKTNEPFISGHASSYHEQFPPGPRDPSTQTSR